MGLNRGVESAWRGLRVGLGLIGAASLVFALALTFVIAGFAPAINANQAAGRSDDKGERDDRDDGKRKHRSGQAIFRYDTFGDEQLWTDVLRMHDVIATVPPATALAVGLKVDVEALPREVKAALRAGAGELLESIRLFDVYSDDRLRNEGRKSLAFALRFRADRTLTVEEASAARDAAIASAAEQIGAELRG